LFAELSSVGLKKSGGWGKMGIRVGLENMSLNAQQLKSKWNKGKDSYLKKEVGDGVQKFVKDFLESPDFFGLKQGLISTPLEKRKNEFTEESKTKAARRVDIIVYINPEIVIPVEVEKHTNIEFGEKQLLQYQLDIEKKYGILTDGFTWRFYNNAFPLKEFNLDQIFSQPDLFLSFWQEYIKPENYYLSFFEKTGQLKLLPEDFSVEARRQDFFRDITTLIRGFKNKLDIEGYFHDLEKKEKSKRATEITYAYIIQFILYKTLVDNDFDDFGKEFDEISKEIYANLKQKQYGKILGIIDGISNKISQNIYRPFKKEQQFIADTLLKLFHQPKNDLHDVSPWLDIFIFIKKYSFVSIKNEIFGYIYENYLKELYEDTKKGQYFTDPAVVNFMLDQVGYTKEEIKKRLKNTPEEDYISVVDPSCGSGTFLYSAVDRLIDAVPDGSEESSKKVEELINDNIFGLDIAEFPLYLAEMNILMRMLPLIINEKYNNPVDKKIKAFLTADSMAEFQDTNIKNTLSDFDIEYNKSGGQMSMFQKAVTLSYSSFMREDSDLEEMKRSLENHKKLRKRFDFVVGNPPYVGYNECSKQKLLIFEQMKKGVVKLNDIYGVNLHSTPDTRKKYSPKPNLYAFFIALGVALLKNNGKLCFIIPQTILIAGDLDVLRYHLAKFTTIEKIITFSGKMFVGRGLKQNKPVATSSLIFVVRRMMPSGSNQVEVIHYNDPDDDVEKCLQNISIGKSSKVKRRKISQIDLLRNVANWNFIKQDKQYGEFYGAYKKNTEDTSIYYNHVLATIKFKTKFYFDIGYNIDEKILLDNKSGHNDYVYPRLDDNFWSVLSVKGYWPNEKENNSKFKIKLLTTNQGYNLLASPYKILWSYINTKNFYFSSLPLIWARNQICAIGSSNKPEILYLFALLNSATNRKLLESMLISENEKDLLVSIASVKQFIRVPKITEDNQFIKDEIIKRVEEMLALEGVIFGDLVDFSGVMRQKFDSVIVEGSNLVLIKGDEKVKCKIKKSKELVEAIIKAKFADNKLLKEKEINLSELKSLPAIDSGKQEVLKNYIDDLVFALYFNVPLAKIGLDKARAVKSACEKNKFYKIVLE